MVVDALPYPRMRNVIISRVISQLMQVQTRTCIMEEVVVLMQTTVTVKAGTAIIVEAAETAVQAVVAEVVISIKVAEAAKEPLVEVSLKDLK